MLERLENGFLLVNRAVIGLMMLCMFGMVFTNVVTRYGFGFSIGWAEEVSSFLMIWITYLGAGLALREGRHVAIDIFQDMLPDRWRHYARAGIAILILLFFGFLTFYGIQFVIFGWSKETMVTQIPRGIPYLAIPIGAAMFALHLIFMFRAFVEKRWQDIDDESEAEPEIGR